MEKREMDFLRSDFTADGATGERGAGVALVHDWLTGMRGGEKCLELLCRRWPNAPLYTLLHRRGSVSAAISDRPIRTSFLNRLPGVFRYYRWLLPLMPFAVRWKFPAETRLIVSLSHCVAKSITPPAGVPHVSYCFSPMRYAWHMRGAYFGGRRGVKARLTETVLSRLREFDRETAANVAQFVAISETIRTRIREAYDRDSVVICPPVDTDFYTPDPAVPREDFLLIVSAFAPYKRLELAIRTCESLGRRLIVIGTGQEAAKLERLAGPMTTFLGWQSDEVIRDHFRRCRGLLFPGEEDFGIVPVEAMACGAPVVAYARGGATETVVPPERSAMPTGLWFADQNQQSLADAIERLDRTREQFQTVHLRRHAERYHPSRFLREFDDLIARTLRPATVRRAA